jgi:vacuolar protein sorting-associated protein 35
MINFLSIYFFWTRVLICLKRALRIANAAQQMSNAARGNTGSVLLFVEILNK